MWSSSDIEHPAERGLDSEDGKEIRGYHFTVQTFRFALARKIERVVPIGGHGLEILILALPIEKIRIGNGGAIENWRLSYTAT